MTEVVRDDSPNEPIETAAEAVAARRVPSTRKPTAYRRPATTLVAMPSVVTEHWAPAADDGAEQREEAAQADRAALIAALELRVRELREIEKMRDLELHRLEEEVEGKNAQVLALETELFHARRRGDDLDRRWNELAATYEQTASALVEAGALLESIHSQVAYRVLLSVAQLTRRRPAVYRTLRRAATWALMRLHVGERTASARLP